jgi:diaminopimelate epimerase
MQSMTYRFFKYQGTGNDFIIFDGITQNAPQLTKEKIALLCDRRFGIGADGLMIILPHESSDFYMLYYNSDGKESTMCGNGGRCISHLAWKNNICNENAVFYAIDGPHKAVLNSNTVKLLMKDGITVIKNEVGDYVINTGSPHYVHFDKPEYLKEIVSFGRSIRYNNTYKDEGINVNIVSLLSNEIQVATYERGVEDETFSCGTGVVAAALATNTLYEINSPISIQTKGGKLKVYFNKNGLYYNEVYLEGPATFVFEGTIEI